MYNKFKDELSNLKETKERDDEFNKKKIAEQDTAITDLRKQYEEHVKASENLKEK
jgi:hypothetical protein